MKIVGITVRVQIEKRVTGVVNIIGDVGKLQLPDQFGLQVT